MNLKTYRQYNSYEALLHVWVVERGMGCTRTAGGTAASASVSSCLWRLEVMQWFAQAMQFAKVRLQWLQAQGKRFQKAAVSALDCTALPAWAHNLRHASPTSCSCDPCEASSATVNPRDIKSCVPLP